MRLVSLLGVTCTLLMTLPALAAPDKGGEPSIKEKAAAAMQLTPTLKVGGSLRFRYENRQDFKFARMRPGNSQDFGLTQIRLNLDWRPASWFGTFVEFQDARIFDAFQTTAVNPDKYPTVFADELDLHQFYLDFKSSTLATKVRIGRQKLNLGAKRLIASLEWVNTARVWDGVRITSQLGNGRTLDTFATRVVPVNNNGFNFHDESGNRLFDSYFHGGYYTDKRVISGGQLEAYSLFRHQPEQNDEIVTLGSRVEVPAGIFRFDGELSGQFGSYGGMSHRAYAGHAGVGAKLSSLKSKLYAGYNFGSGDSNPNDQVHETFDNQYPLNHAYYGYMDFFSLQNAQSTELIYTIKPTKFLNLRAAYHAFWIVQPETDAWYNAATAAISPATPGAPNYAGSEINLTFGLSLMDGLMNFNGGYGHFFAGDYVRFTGGDKNADFVYLQTRLAI